MDKEQARKLYELTDRLSKLDVNTLSEEQLAERTAMIARLQEVKQRLDPKCWDGYKKQGTKIKGGVRVNNCVPESVEQGVEEADMSRRGFLGALAGAGLAAAGLGAAGSAMAGPNDPGYVKKVQDKHFEMVEKNPRYANEHQTLQLPFARGMTGNSAEMNKQWAIKTAQLLQKYGVKVNEGVAEGSDNITAVFSGYGNYMKGRGANVFKHYGITVLDRQYDEDEDIAEYTVSGSKEALDQARAYLERSDQFGGMILQQGVAEGSQRVDSLVTDALKLMRGSEVSDAVRALTTVLGNREYNSRRGHYNFYVRQLIDMYNKQGVSEASSPAQQAAIVELYQIDETVLNEIDPGLITNLVSVFPTVAKIIVSNALTKANNEKQETAQMIDVLKKKASGEPVTPEETEAMKTQFKDLIGYGLTAVGSALTGGALAGIGSVYKKEIFELIKSKGPEVLINLLKSKGNLDVVKILSSKFLGKHALPFYTAPKVQESKKTSPKLTPVNIKKTDPVSEEINKEAYERLQKVFAFKNYES